MTIESPVDYIGDLDDSYPAEGESNTLHEGNDHIRNIKTALLNTLGSPGAEAYTLANILYYTSGSGTYTPPSDIRAIYVECYGAGGGAAASSSSYMGMGAPGGGGTYCAKLITSLAASYSYAVGAGGAGGATSGAYGSGGGTTTFAGTGTSLSAGGGFGGISTITSSGWYGIGHGGTSVSGGDINLVGAPSEYTRGYLGALYTFPNSGRGAGPLGGAETAGLQDSAGAAGKAPGGGGGAPYASTAVLYAGGDGGSGLIRITEYY